MSSLVLNFSLQIASSVTSRALSPIPEVVHPETQHDLASGQQSMPLPRRDLFNDCVLMGQYLDADINNPSNIRIGLQAPLPPEIIPSPTIRPPEIPRGDTSLPKRNAFRLTHSWTLYHDCRVRKHANASLKPSSCTYAANLMAIGQFYSVEGFCRYFNWLKRPSELAMGDSYHLFKSGIEPVWEDPMNENVSITSASPLFALTTDCNLGRGVGIEYQVASTSIGPNLAMACDGPCR